MSRTALAFSPHLDDAAFSCGGTLATLAARVWRVIVATVFTASVEDPQGFALACQLDKGLPAEVDYMALRRAEDEAACRALGVERPVWLPFREAPHRGYGSAPELFAGVQDDDRMGDALRSAFRELIGRHAPDLLLGPQAVGGHVDHIQVARALGAARGTRPLLWWTDFPYTLRSDTPRRPLADTMTALAQTTLRLTPGSRASKRAACLAYVSQLGFQFGGPQGLDRRLAEAGDEEVFRVEGPMPPL